MINHARTILLNMPALEGDGPLAPGEEFIPKDFAPIKLPAELLSVHTILIPEAATRADRNYLGFAYMQLAHTPDFVKYVQALDRRVTYNFEDSYFLEVVFRDGPPVPLNFQTISNKMLVEIVKLNGRGMGLFATVQGFEQQMLELQQLWRSAPNSVDRLIAATLALIYRIDEVRRRRRT